MRLLLLVDEKAPTKKKVTPNKIFNALTYFHKNHSILIRIQRGIKKL